MANMCHHYRELEGRDRLVKVAQQDRLQELTQQLSEAHNTLLIVLSPQPRPLQVAYFSLMELVN